MLNVEDVATPFTPVTPDVPDRVPPARIAPIAFFFNHVAPAEIFPLSLRAALPTADIVWPAWVVCGCVVKVTWVAGGGGAAVMLKLTLVAPVSPLALAVSV